MTCRDKVEFICEIKKWDFNRLEDKYKLLAHIIDLEVDPELFILDTLYLLSDEVDIAYKIAKINRKERK